MHFPLESTKIEPRRKDAVQTLHKPHNPLMPEKAAIARHNAQIGIDMQIEEKQIGIHAQLSSTI